MATGATASTRRAPVPIEDVPEEVNVSQLSLRRTLSTFAASAMVVGGSAVFVVAAAGADTAGPTAVPAGAIALNNATATAGTPCPDDGFAYWHFVLAPNGKSLAFTEISLELSTEPTGTEVQTFDGDELVPNGSQLDNIFVAVPAGHTLDDIVLGDQSFARYSGTGAVNFTLSHTCVGEVPTTTSTSTSTSTTATTQPSTTTTEATTTTTEATTTTTEATTTTTEATTTTTEATTTTAGPEEEATTSSVTVQDEVLGTVQTAAAVEAAGELPYTGSNVGAMVVAGLTVVVGGAVLAGLARTARRT